jgi:hypothetical protein
MGDTCREATRLASACVRAYVSGSPPRLTATAPGPAWPPSMFRNEKRDA